ncbi:T9SS type A sorting domain-containing protein [Hanstruepera ponticola]|uniref:T9SS type A sorting domain-containing protein n=1 Tax=Hanstruepera ponticola TaxID=2042995 RepID=UPI00177BB7B3|nr:T9SS type A sorting domain-containing protein [Hanstruepera ponticola]
MKYNYLFLIALISFTFSQAQIVNIPDANFKNALVNTNCVDTDGDYTGDIDADTNNDGEIQVSEAEAVLSLDVLNRNIDSLEGISSFVNLEMLNCTANYLTNLDVSDLTNLTDLLCGSNLLTNLNITGLTNIEFLNCSRNRLTTLNVTALTNLDRLFCDNNDLSTLNLSGLTNLTELNCSVNYLTALDLSSLVNLVDLDCSNGFDFFFNSLDLSGLVSLENLDCTDLYLESLDVNESPNLTDLDCSNNELTSLFMKNGSHIEYLDIYNNPDLEYICTDDFEIDYVKNRAELFGLTDCEVNSYCFFEPGGNFYVIDGQTHLDFAMDGCDVSDDVYPNLKLNVNDGVINRYFIPGNDGSHSFPVLEGEHTVTPVLENLDYFTVTPESMTVNFPTEASPYNQDFCITPNGVYNDLEVFIIPLEQARPGFDTDYKVLYKNKGNTTLSGTVLFDYDENRDAMTFVSATPEADNVAGNIVTWNYSNLQPFESREVLVTLNMNTPTDTPPLNGGDDIGYVADIYPKDIDETAHDNNFQIKLTVVNSFDPNDKTCLQGETITPEEVGDYVHYLIRFENTGTASAVNIVVRDEIDTAKYDVSTLLPLNSSHDFITEIKDDNIVEFIFEDINLPFDDANNDGYVLFKIKTLETLELGDTFSNDAEIYFDYNAPIITNDELTTVAENLSVEETELQNLITVYPNPAADVIILESKTNLESIIVYDVHGRQVLTQLTSTNQLRLNVSNLVKGIYFLNLKTVDGEQTTKFIKK